MLEMISLVINYHLEKRKFKFFLALQSKSFYRALRLLEIDKVLKWPRRGGVKDPQLS